MIYYLPSCKYKAAHPQSSQKIQRYLSGLPDVRIAGCCRVSQSLFAPGDTVLTNCTSCAAITDEVSPQAKECSVYEYLLGIPDFPWPDYAGEAITVQDCYRSRHKPAMMRAVRECLRRMDLRPVELAENLENTRFDGVFQFAPVAKGNLELAPAFFTPIQQSYVEPLPPEEQKKRMQEWVRQYRTDRVVVYCNSCLAGVRLGGANGVHLLDLITRDLPEV